jgi:hypothetical protein
MVTLPLLRCITLIVTLEEAETARDLLSAMSGLATGILIGGAGVFLLGFLCDGGQGYKPIWLLATMTVVGVLWIGVYPGGWLVGVPLAIYAGAKLVQRLRTRPALEQTPDEARQ